MYKIKGGKLKIFSKYIEIQPGQHTVYVDMDSGSVSYTGEDGYVPVVEYRLDEFDGTFEIVNDYVGELGEQGVRPPTEGLTWMDGRLISKGPLSDGNTNIADVNVALDGFAFAFNYTSIAHTAQALKPYRWTGGRVCSSHGMFDPGASNTSYTAMPGAGSCGRGFADTYGSGVGQMADTAALLGAPISGANSAARASDWEYVGNNFSIVFSYRTFRKYVSFAKGMAGVFECSLGPFGGKESDAEPDGDVGNIRLKSFQMSMYNLSQ
jgi:hypothetical protein